MVLPALRIPMFAVAFWWGIGVALMGTADAQTKPAAKPDAKLAANKYRYWNTQWSFEAVDVGKIIDRLSSIGIDVPVQARGTVTVRFDVGVPLNALRTGEAYRIDGHIDSPSLAVGQLQLSRFDSDVALRDGTLSLSKIRGVLSDLSTGESGSFAAEVSAKLIAQDDQPKPLRINAALDGVPVRPVAELIGGDASEAVTGESNRSSPIARADDDVDSGAIDGSVTGKLVVATDLRRLGDTDVLRTAGNVRIDDLQLAGVPPLRVQTGDFNLTDGQLVAESIDIRSTDGSGIALAGRVNASLRGDRPFDVSLRGNDVPLSALSMLVDGKVDLDIRGSGQLGDSIDRGQWEITGRVASPGIRVAGQPTGLIEHRIELTQRRIKIVPLADLPSDASASVANNDLANTDLTDDDLVLRRLVADYAIEPDQIRVSNLDTAIYGGQISGGGRFARDASGDHQIDLSWDGITPRIDRALVRRFLGGGADFISGSSDGLSRAAIVLQTSGSVDWTVPADRIDEPAAHRGTAEVDLQSLVIGGQDVGAVELALQTDGQQIDLRGEGKLFGGQLRVTSGAAIDAVSRWSDVATRLAAVRLELRRIELSQLMPVVRPSDRRRYSGRATLVADFGSDRTEPIVAVSRIEAADNGEADRPLGIGDGDIDLMVMNFGIGGQMISRRIDAAATLRDGVLRIDEFSGRYAGGGVTATGQWNFGGEAVSRLRIRLDGVRAARGLRVVTDAIGSVFDGRVSGVVSLASGGGSGGGGSVSLTGRLTSRQSVAVGLPLGELTTPIALSVGPKVSRWSVSFPSIRGNSHGGMLVGDLAFSSSGGGVGFDMDGDFGARHVDFGEVLAEAGMTSSLAHGDLTGGLTIGGTRIRGVNDLRGRFAADLDAATGAAIPGLAEASRFFTGITLGSTRITDGSVTGLIGRGAIQIEEFTARSEQILVVADGRVGLRDMRMDIGAVISTGQFALADDAAASEIAPRLIRRLAINTVLPGATLIEIGRLASNRTVFVQITGPVSDPVVRLRPVETARAALTRAAVDQLIPLILGGAGSDSVFDF